MMRSRVLALAAVLSLGAAVGCADPVEPPDAGVTMDATSTDAMPVDAQAPDDSGTPVIDGGVVPVDAAVDAGPTDAEPPVRGLRLRSSSLAPTTGRASSPRYNLEGRLRPTTNGPARSTNHRLRGGVVAGGTRANTP